jgi:hypothetical protein
MSVHNYSPPQSQYFVEPIYTAITDASLLGYISKLGTSNHWDFCPFFKAKLLQLLLVGWVLLVNNNLYVIPQILNWIEVWALTRPFQDI